MTPPHEYLDERAQELAALYAARALTPAEHVAFEAHLDRCPLCAAEARSLSEVMTDSVAAAVPVERPSPGLEGRLFDRIRNPAAQKTEPVQVWKTWSAVCSASGAHTFMPASGSEWVPTAVAGVSVRRLSLDRAADRVTMLVRMEPGSSYPPHRHAGPEECLVLTGDITTGDLRMGPDDYLVAHAGSQHGPQTTEGGCTLFISSSLHDELLDVADALAG